MPTIVRSGGGGTDVSDATAVESNVLSGRTFYAGEDSDIKTGTMTNKGAVSTTAPYTGGGGYYSSINVSATGNATNAQVVSGKTFMNANGAQTGTMVNRGAVTINVNESGGEGYYSSVSINKSSLGNATAAQVLSNVTFTNNTGTTQNGTMINQGSFICALDYGNSTTANGAGYYSSISVTAPSRYGDATAAYVYNGKTFMNSTGNQTGSLKLDGTATTGDVLSNKTFHAGDSTTIKTGTMSNYGSVSKSISPGETWTGGKGYYTSITINAENSASKTSVFNGKDASSTWQTTNTGRSDWTYVTVGYASNSTAGYWDNNTCGSSVRCKPGIKYYLSGTNVHWCTNGSANISGMKIRILAWLSDD